VGDDRAPLIPFDAATAAVLASLRPLPAVEVPALDTAGRVLSAALVAPEDVPPAPISAMDGYAVPAAVLRGLVADGSASARVVGEVAAGAPGFADPPGDDAVVRIFTGGVVPPWAAAVVVQEHATRDGDTVVLRGPAKDHTYIRDAGSDIRAGDEALPAGTTLHPPAMALLASLGVDRVAVAPRLAVGIVVTGSEVVAGGPLAVGQVRDSNGPALEAAARACGAGEVLRATAPDRPEALREVLAGLLPRVDLLITSGGVSVGDHDHVKEVLEGLGARRVFWGVAQRPGKPLWYGTWNDRPVFGLPGNPASSLATFLAHGWPAMRRLQGATPEIVRRRAVLSAPATKARGFTAMLRGRQRQDGATTFVEPSGPQESHQMVPFARSDCLILCPPDADVLAPGTEVEILPYPWTM